MQPCQVMSRLLQDPKRRCHSICMVLKHIRYIVVGQQEHFYRTFGEIELSPSGLFYFGVRF